MSGDTIARPYHLAYAPGRAAREPGLKSGESDLGVRLGRIRTVPDDGGGGRRVPRAETDRLRSAEARAHRPAPPPVSWASPAAAPVGTTVTTGHGQQMGHNGPEEQQGQRSRCSRGLPARLRRRNPAVRGREPVGAGGGGDRV